MHPMKCEAHSRNEAENLPFATNRLVKIDDLKAKIEGYDESKNHRQKHLKAKLKVETFLKQSVLSLFKVDQSLISDNGHIRGAWPGSWALLLGFDVDGENIE